MEFNEAISNFQYMKNTYTFIKVLGNKKELTELPRFPQVESTALSQSVIHFWKNVKAIFSLLSKRIQVLYTVIKRPSFPAH
jgi:hypothetical protein